MVEPKSVRDAISSATDVYGKKQNVLMKEINPSFENGQKASGSLVIDFNNIKSLAYTRPLSFSYFESHQEAVGSWKKLYAGLMNCLVNDYPHILDVNRISHFGKVGRLDYGIGNVVNSMTAPRQLENGCWIETNYGATDIVKKIRFILELCNVDFENVEIYYSVKEVTKPTASKREIPLKPSPFLSHAWPDGRQVNFHEDGTFTFTKPIAFRYRDKEYLNIKSWTQLYVEVMRCLNGDYPEVIQRLIGTNLSGARTIDFGSKNDYAKMRAPKEITDNLYVETNMDSTDITRKLRMILDLCGVDYAELEIVFRSKKDGATGQQSQQTRFAVEAIPARRGKNDLVLLRYKELLDKFFRKGFRMESSLDMKKLRRFYQEQYGTELSDEDGFVCQDISSVTILHDGKAYLPGSMLSREKKEKLLHYIEDKFHSGCDAIYYGALFLEFEEILQGERIYTPEMLKTFLAYVNKGAYVINRSYLAKDCTVRINPEDEIREYLKKVAEPVEVEQLTAELSYIPEQKIRFALSSNSDFIRNTAGEYFYEDSVHFSNSELEWISRFIEKGIEERDFVTGNELVEAVETHFPEIKEMNQRVTPLGMRNVIGYKLSDRFSFHGNIISKHGEDLSMAEVYAKYCQKHSRFTLDELNVLKQELGSMIIYFDEVYTNSLRISQNEFVSLNMAQFDVEATDEAIGRICSGSYMALREIRDFGTFPYAGYPWNEYLLEHFVASYSQKFKLLHIGYNANVCAGAIVKQESSFKDFNDLLIDVLANSKTMLDEDSALEYLRQQGYIARKRYSDIGRILTEAKVVRARKG